MYLIPKYPEPEIPEGITTRVNDIIYELQNKVKVTEAPNSVAVLLRVLLEISVDNCIAKMPLKKSYSKLEEKIWGLANKLHKKGLIEKEQRELLESMKGHENAITVHKLHKWVHSNNYHPDPKTLNRTWNELAFFICLCWK